MDFAFQLFFLFLTHVLVTSLIWVQISHLLLSPGLVGKEALGHRCNCLHPLLMLLVANNTRLNECQWRSSAASQSLEKSLSGAWTTKNILRLELSQCVHWVECEVSLV